jgi:hypothetical protein
MSSRSKPVVKTQAAQSPDQLEVFESAIKLFHAKNFRAARERFLAAKRGGDRGIAHKAELHVRMCDHRLEEPAVLLRTADEHYDYAITVINDRKLPEARQHLMKAREQQTEAAPSSVRTSRCLNRADVELSHSRKAPCWRFV